MVQRWTQIDANSVVCRLADVLAEGAGVRPVGPAIPGGVKCYLSRSDHLRLGFWRRDRLAQVTQRLHMAVDRFADGFNGFLARPSSRYATGEVRHINTECAVVGRFDDDGVFRSVHKIILARPGGEWNAKYPEECRETAYRLQAQ